MLNQMCCELYPLPRISVQDKALVAHFECRHPQAEMLYRPKSHSIKHQYLNYEVSSTLTCTPKQWWAVLGSRA